MYLDYYKNLLGINNIPYFLNKYLKCPSLVRLKKVGYFCGMDYASKDIYDFREYISRYDHSLTVALITYRLTKNKKATLAALFHDVATPCFSHVIDYMNKDYAKQESTEEYTEKIMLNDKYFRKCLAKDRININDIIDFKKYTIVDNNRPKVCADRIDGVILTGIGWTKNITLTDIERIVSSMCILQNEDKELEICFNNRVAASRVLEISESIDIICHSNEDNYMMELLAIITKKAIDDKLFSYDELYTLNEDEVYSLISHSSDKELLSLYEKFKNVKLDEIEMVEIPEIKKRDLNPIIQGKRAK